jgi:hypothetical protein
MTNKKRIEKVLSGTEFTLGGFNDKLEKLNPANLKKVMDDMLYGSTDVDVFINRKPFVVEVSHVDNEIDFGIITKAEYINRYGDERYDD